MHKKNHSNKMEFYGLKLKVFALAALLPALWLSSASAESFSVKNSLKADGQAFITYSPNLVSIANQAGQISPEQLLSDWLLQNNPTLTAEDFYLKSEQKSLLATHYRFQQSFKGVDVDTAEIIISVKHQDNSVMRVYDNAKAGTPAASVSTMNLNDQTATEAAWNHIGVTGDLLSQPRSQLILVDRRGLRYVYQVRLDVSEPAGTWQVLVDANTGRVLEALDTRVNLHQHAPVKPRFKNSGKKVVKFKTALQKWNQKLQKKSIGLHNEGIKNTANGRALVFNPDPLTALNNGDLVDNSNPSDFLDAYLQVDLRDITTSEGVYSLEGPWVKIVDFDSPSVTPSTTTDGNWDGHRGDTSFNDVMIYYHLDTSQRYMQSLGFVGDRGIQHVQIQADSNGASGADNSYFSPGENRLSFGAGCVDDAEDADVILHEYGHAINYSINQSWGGRDAGAMGEGFGDYWAQSFSIAQEFGMSFLPFKVFTWDGISNCWPGRRLDVLDAQYDPSRSYSAHESVGNFVSDELWSTPLFQTLFEAMSTGMATREEIDTIILEAQFGMGSGISMRDMANSIIATAAELYPNGPHANLFTRKFLNHNIVDIPAPNLEIVGYQVLSAGSNGIPEPGELVVFKPEISNAGTLGVSGGVLEITSTKMGVEIVAGSSPIGQMEQGQTNVSLDNMQIRIASTIGCGQTIPINYTISSNKDGERYDFEGTFEINTGTPRGVDVASNTAVDIVDNDPNGVASFITVENAEGTVSDELNVTLDIVHTYIGDLQVKLRAPNGSEIVLHNQSGGGQDNLQGNYPSTLQPAEPLSSLNGSPLNGEWRLFIADTAGSDVGTLNSWRIKNVTGYICEE